MRYRIEKISAFKNIPEKIISITFCPFCEIGLFESGNLDLGFKQKGLFCISCKKLFYVKDGIWYYRRIRNGKLCKKENIIPKIDYCLNCNGQGFIQMKRCKYCMGTGRRLK